MVISNVDAVVEDSKDDVTLAVKGTMEPPRVMDGTTVELVGVEILPPWP